MKGKDYIWPAIGLSAVVLSLWLLYGELRGISVDDVWAGFGEIPVHGWGLSVASAIVAYAAIAGYDHVALTHLGRKVPWLFVTVCSFTTYALSHNIGGSVFSGAVIRYRAYATRGLSGQEVGVLVAVCWFTFVLSSILLGGVVLLAVPGLLDRFAHLVNPSLSTAAGLVLLIVVAAYVFGSWLHLKPVKISSFQLHYPSLPIVALQMVIGPIELVAAAAIIYFALPAAGNPGFMVVLGVFIISFTIAQISHAPGGLGVFEVVFLRGLSDMDPAAVLAALVVFRLLYLILPLMLALVAVIIFERSQFGRRVGPGRADKA